MAKRLLNFGFTRSNMRKGTADKRPREEHEAGVTRGVLCDRNNNSEDETYEKKRIREFQTHWRDKRPCSKYNDINIYKIKHNFILQFLFLATNQIKL